MSGGFLRISTSRRAMLALGASLTSMAPAMRAQTAEVTGRAPEPAALAAAPMPAGPAIEAPDVLPRYLETLVMVERARHRLLDVIKDEFDRRGVKDITGAQALMLYHVGDKTLPIGELRRRGYYLNRDVSRCVGRLKSCGYLTTDVGAFDRRQRLVTLTDEGLHVGDVVAQLFSKHVRVINAMAEIGADDLDATSLSLRRLERFWTDQIRFRL